MSERLQFILFAGDTNVFYHDKDLLNAQNVINSDLKSLHCGLELINSLFILARLHAL